MTTFIDGPARGKALALRRAPYFLRLVNAVLGEWDALDQLGDKPEPIEKIYAYRLTEKPGMMHLKASKGGGWFPIATYQLCEPQPPDVEMRNEDFWVKWTDSQPVAEWFRIRI